MVYLNSRVLKQRLTVKTNAKKNDTSFFFRVRFFHVCHQDSLAGSGWDWIRQPNLPLFSTKLKITNKNYKLKI